MAAGPSLLLLVGMLFVAAASLNANADADVLLKLRKLITDPDGKLRSWVAGTNPCGGGGGKGHGNWDGVICDEGNLHGLQLENMSLSGMLNISVSALKELPNLRTLSFKDNQIFALMPDMKNLAGMRNIFLSNNKLSGEIPDDAFQGMSSLKKVDLSGNGFFGPIPTSLALVPKLLQLRLDDNNFSGAIPDLRQKELNLLNVSRNQLEGKIPDGLKNVKETFFDGTLANPCFLPCFLNLCSSSSSSSSIIIISSRSATTGNKNLCGEAIGNLVRRRRRRRRQQHRLRSRRHRWPLRNSHRNRHQ